MKAREWYAKLKGCVTIEEYENILENCLRSLVSDADNLIRIRRATSDHAVAACINEVNNKWVCILNTRDNDTSIPENHPMMESKLLKDGFKAAYVTIHPNRGWYFDIKRHKSNVAEEQLKFLGFDLTKPVLILFGLTPYDKMQDFTVNDLRREFLHAAYTLGSISHNNNNWPEHVKMSYSKILARHMFLIKTWINVGKIDISDADKDDVYIMEKYGVSF